jgi:multidrug efflux system membrane fusion protein
MLCKLYKPFVGVVGLAFVFGCHKPLPVTAPATVRVGSISEVTADVEARYSFSLLPYRQTDLAFKSGGIVDQIAQVRGTDGHMREITMGDTAPEGLRLARVRMLDYQHQLETASAGLAQATASLASAKASQQLANLNFERASALYRQASLTKQNFDQAQQQKLSADAAVRQAEATIASNETNIRQAKLALSDTSVVSPFKGVVVSRQIELGNVASSGLIAFQVADIYRLKADFTVPDTLLPSLPKGKQIGLALPGISQPVIATISSISPTSDPNSHLFTVEILLANPELRLKPGMIGSLSFTQGNSARQVLTVPLSSLVHTNNGAGFSVFLPVQKNGRTYAKLQPVEIGSGVGQNVEMKSGVSLGQNVITVGAQMLHDGDEIQVVQ